MVMGGRISAYGRKYPSTSWTSERHIPHALTFTRISSGWMSGIGISSRTTGLLYSWIRAALMSALLSKWWVFRIQVSFGGWLTSALSDAHNLLLDLHKFEASAITSVRPLITSVAPRLGKSIGRCDP